MARGDGQRQRPAGDGRGGLTAVPDGRGSPSTADDPGRGAAALVVGASGGIGRALVAALVGSGRFEVVHALSRSGSAHVPGARPGRIDITEEASVAAAVEALGSSPPLRLAIVATGLLHADGVSPEKTWRDLDAERLATTFRVNAIGPALVAKHLLPRLPRTGRSVFAALSARVGSIGDNRLGGWYGYRASKAALNQLLRTLAIELARTRPDAICLGLHPGTVATGLSAPFRSGVAQDRLFSPEDAASRLLAVIAAARPVDSGRILAWDGSIVPP